MSYRTTVTRAIPSLVGIPTRHLQIMLAACLVSLACLSSPASATEMECNVLKNRTPITGGPRAELSSVEETFRREIGAYLDTWPEIVLVQSRVETGRMELIAQTCPGDLIYLSTDLISFCRSFPDDSCLAFVLGHELSHLASADYVEMASLVHSDDPVLRETKESLLGDPAILDKEKKADQHGFFLLVLAGFDPGPLIENDLFGQLYEQGDIPFRPDDLQVAVRKLIWEMTEAVTPGLALLGNETLDLCPDGVIPVFVYPADGVTAGSA